MHQSPPRAIRTWIVEAWRSRTIPIAIVIIISVGFLILWIILPKLDIHKSDPADVFEGALDGAILNSLHSFMLWSTINMVVQFVLVITALLATVAASLTTTENAETIKRWSVVLTAVTAALASVLSTFNIRQNTETHIQSTQELSHLQIKYMAARAAIDPPVKKGDKPSKELLELQLRFTPEFLDIQGRRLRAWANAGQQLAPGSSQQFSQNVGEQTQDQKKQPR